MAKLKRKFIMEKINQLISYLIAIANFAKDIHYSSCGEAFYGKHLLADRLQENIYDFIDQLKEVCLLGNEIEPLSSIEYLKAAISIIPLKNNADDKANFIQMKELLIETLSLIEELSDLTRGEDNLIGNIAQELENNLGLVNLQVKD